MSVPRRCWALIALTCCLSVASGCRESTQDNPSPETRQQQGLSQALPVVAEVPPFRLMSSRDVEVSNETLRGKPYVAAFMFSRCPSVCPKVTKKMRSVAERAGQAGHDLNFVSFSVDGEHDTPSVLRDYAEKHDVTDEHFLFLTGDPRSVVETAERGFKIGVSGEIDESKEHLGMSHGSHLVLVDAKGRIRGYYRSFDEDVAARLVADLPKLSGP